MNRREVLVGMLVAIAAGLVGRRGWDTVAEAATQGGAGAAASTPQITVYSAARKGYVMTARVTKSDAEWRKQLTPEQYQITRKKGTERAFTGKYWNNHAKGLYRCVCCGNDLYDSATQYDSGTGWPSFFAPIAQENIRTQDDSSFFSKRVEVLCARCDAHLGHVFPDGPKPTGLRYCMNSAALEFAKSE